MQRAGRGVMQQQQRGMHVSHSVKNILREFWEVLDMQKNSRDELTKQGYINMNLRLQQALNLPISEAEAMAAAEDDWALDCGDKSSINHKTSMNFRKFVEATTEMLTLFGGHNHQNEELQGNLLNALLDTITQPAAEGEGRSLKPVSEIQCVGNVQKLLAAYHARQRALEEARVAAITNKAAFEAAEKERIERAEKARIQAEQFEKTRLEAEALEKARLERVMAEALAAGPGSRPVSVASVASIRTPSRGSVIEEVWPQSPFGKSMNANEFNLLAMRRTARQPWLDPLDTWTSPVRLGRKAVIPDIVQQDLDSYPTASSAANSAIAHMAEIASTSPTAPPPPKPKPKDQNKPTPALPPVYGIDANLELNIVDQNTAAGRMFGTPQTGHREASEAVGPSIRSFGMPTGGETRLLTGGEARLVAAMKRVVICWQGESQQTVIKRWRGRSVTLKYDGDRESLGKMHNKWLSVFKVNTADCELPQLADLIDEYH